MHNLVARPVKFVVRNKSAIIVTTFAIAAVATMRVGLAQHDAFLKEHDLYDAFYAQTETD